MKKLLFIAIMMMAALSVNAQGEESITPQQYNIKGAWHSLDDDMRIYFTFGDNGLVNAMIKGYFNGDVFSTQVTIMIPGTYSVTGSKIYIVADKERCDMKLENLKMNGDYEGMEDNARPMFEEYFSKHKEELISSFDFDDITIVSVTDDTLKLKMGRDDIMLERVK